MSEEAIQTWQEKLDYYLAEEAKCSDPEQKFNLHKAIEEAKAKLAELGSRKTQDPTSPAVPVSLEKLPASGPNFLGREAEIKLLDDAWADGGRTHVAVLVAPGGVGKTTLVKRWLDRLKSNGWRGAGRVYSWSFYSQSTSDDRQASDDAFLNDALRWFGVEHDPALSPWDKGRLLAEAIARRRTLLVLDGVEPLQYPPGPQGGALRAPGVQALLRALAGAGQPGLCVITTRETVGDLAEYERTADNPTGGVLAHDLGNLADSDGARLLHRLGVTRAGQQPEYALLYSVQGFQYCDLLLGDAEDMAWTTTLASVPDATDRPKLDPPLGSLREVERRATQTLKWAEDFAGASLLTVALDRLTLGRAALYRAILKDSSFEPAREPLMAAVDGLRASGEQIWITAGVLTRAWLRFMEGDSAGAKADLDESWQIAERGSMKLHMADILLYRARLFRDRAALGAAATLIEETGYHRRDDELADAREALNQPQS